jgi:hypothetical protein
VLAGEERTPLPCDDLHVEGGELVVLLDGRWHRWAAEDVHSAKWLDPSDDGWRAAFSRARWPRHLTRDEARAMLRRRPASLAGGGR